MEINSAFFIHNSGMRMTRMRNALVFFPHFYFRMERTPFPPFCQDGRRRDVRYVPTGEKSGYTFGHNETLLLLSTRLFSVMFAYKKKANW